MVERAQFGRGTWANSCLYPRAAFERGAGQTENHTQQHKDRAKRDGCKRAWPSDEQRIHGNHKLKEKRAFLIFSKITKKSADSLAP